MFQEDLGILIAGDCHQKAIQFTMNLNANTGKVQKKFGILGIAHVSSSVYIGHLAILGGGSSSVRFIDMKNRKLIGNVLKTEISIIKFMQICPIINPENNDDWKVFLCVCGTESNNKSLSDVFDITKLVKIMKISFSVIEKAHLTS